MTDTSEQAAPQPVEQLPIPLFDGVVLAARTTVRSIWHCVTSVRYLALLCAHSSVASAPMRRYI